MLYDFGLFPYSFSDFVHPFSQTRVFLRIRVTVEPGDGWAHAGECRILEASASERLTQCGEGQCVLAEGSFSFSRLLWPSGSSLRRARMI
jgi:hypothetical protein